MLTYLGIIALALAALGVFFVIGIFVLCMISKLDDVTIGWMSFGLGMAACLTVLTVLLP